MTDTFRFSKMERFRTLSLSRLILTYRSVSHTFTNTLFRPDGPFQTPWKWTSNSSSRNVSDILTDNLRFVNTDSFNAIIKTIARIGHSNRLEQHHRHPPNQPLRRLVQLHHVPNLPVGQLRLDISDSSKHTVSCTLYDATVERLLERYGSFVHSKIFVCCDFHAPIRLALAVAFAQSKNLGSLTDTI